MEFCFGLRAVGATPHLHRQPGRDLLSRRRLAGTDRNAAVLALSGGADDGAFGAGLMAAWTARGDRPEFQTVTGVSTGALSAPFVFLGPDWDDELRRVYGGFPPDRIFATRFLVDILPRASAADSAPLAALIAEFVDERFLALVAREHRRGRRLLVQTTNLDAQRAVIWDMGAIAASGAPSQIILLMLPSAARRRGRAVGLRRIPFRTMRDFAPASRPGARHKSPHTWRRTDLR